MTYSILDSVPPPPARLSCDGFPRAESERSSDPARVPDDARDSIEVLLIEDDVAICEMYSMKLTFDGYSVTTASDGDEGIAKAKEVRPDIIFLDVRMPKKDGFEVLAALRADPATSHIPVVVLSNYGAGELVQRALALGASEYLIKSNTTPGSLSDGIAEWVRR